MTFFIDELYKFFHRWIRLLSPAVDGVGEQALAYRGGKIRPAPPAHSNASSTFPSASSTGTTSELMEGVSRLDPDEKHVIRELVEGILLKHEAKRLVQKVS